MDRGLGRVFLTIGIISLILLIGLLFIFGGSKPKKSPTTPAVQPLPTYATTDAEVSMTIDGPVNGDDVHRQVRVRVDQYGRHFEIIQGYSDTVIDRHDFTNSTNAYRVFLKSLYNQGFMAARKNVKKTDYEGQCPLGQRFIFRLSNGGDQLSQLWATNCGTSIATLASDPGPLTALFESQITGFNDLTQNENLGIPDSGLSL